MSDLVIFISHKLRSQAKAEKIAEALSAFGGRGIRILYSGEYRAGTKYRPQIENDLSEASWLILLYEGPQFEWLWCAYEIGFFTAKMPSKKDPKLICLHSPEYDVSDLPAPIQDFNSLPATPDQLKAFYGQIYVDDPWKLHPGVFKGNQALIDSKIDDIITAVRSTSHFACPSFLVQIKVDKLQILQDGKIPLDAELSGEAGWETIFGKPVPTESCKWQEIETELESPEPWIYAMATLMWQAYDGQRVQYPSVGVRIKFRDQNVDEYRVFRLCLQRVDVIGDEASFAFIAAALVVPYEPANNPNETRLYHLYNLAWFFRRRLLERELTKLDFELLNKFPKEEKLKQIIGEISNDFKTLLADAQVRGMEQEAAVIQSFKSPLREQVKQKLFEEWPKLYDELLTHLKVGITAAEQISVALHNMEPINRFFLKVSVEELARFIDHKLLTKETTLRAIKAKNKSYPDNGSRQRISQRHFALEKKALGTLPGVSASSRRKQPF